MRSDVYNKAKDHKTVVRVESAASERLIKLFESWVKSRSGARGELQVGDATADLSSPTVDDTKA